jgi:hypothetical protein
VSVANAGDSVIVMDGTYGNNGVGYGNYVVTLSHSGTSSSWVTIQAQHRGMAILDAGSGPASSNTSCSGASSYFNLANASFIAIQGFVIQHACDQGIQSNGSAHDVLIKWNEIRNVGQWFISDIYGRDGIYLNSSEKNFTFDGNTFHDIGRTGSNGVLANHDHGIYAAATGLTIINNIFYNFPWGWSIQTSQGATNWLIANNDFIGPDSSTSFAGLIMLWETNSNITMQNNIFYQPRGSALTSYQASVSGSVFDHNMVYGVSAIGNPSGVSVGVGNLLGVNPQFNNPGGYDFTLKAGSPAIGAGVTISSVVNDYNGVPRSAPYSMGAYQGGTPPSGPVITAISSSGVISVIITWTTDQPSTSFVKYGTTASYGSTTPVNAALVTSHSVTINGLSPNTTYHFAVGSTNGSGVLTVSGDNAVSL